MSQHIQHHHQPQYVHYTPPGVQQSHHHQTHPYQLVATVGQQGLPLQVVHHQPPQQHVIVSQHPQQHVPVPAMTHHQQPQQVMGGQQPQHHQQPAQQPQQQQSASSSGSIPHNGTSTPNSAQKGPLIATGDWTKDLIQLSKQAELKKHALTLQLHTAHLLSTHASLEQKEKSIQDLREQKNKLESERTRLLNCLREINADRDQVDLLQAKLEKDCQEARMKIQQLTDGDYAMAKSDVDRLRVELGHPPLPSIQETLEEKTAQYLNERRLNGNHEPQGQSNSSSTAGTPAVSVPASTSVKRPAPPPSTGPSSAQETPSKRPRGRPKGSKNKHKSDGV